MKKCLIIGAVLLSLATLSEAEPYPVIIESGTSAIGFDQLQKNVYDTIAAEIGTHYIDMIDKKVGLSVKNALSVTSNAHVYSTQEVLAGFSAVDPGNNNYEAMMSTVEKMALASENSEIALLTLSNNVTLTMDAPLMLKANESASIAGSGTLSFTDVEQTGMRASVLVGKADFSTGNLALAQNHRVTLIGGGDYGHIKVDGSTLTLATPTDNDVGVTSGVNANFHVGEVDLRGNASVCVGKASIDTSSADRGVWLMVNRVNAIGTNNAIRINGRSVLGLGSRVNALSDAEMTTLLGDVMLETANERPTLVTATKHPDVEGDVLIALGSTASTQSSGIFVGSDARLVYFEPQLDTASTGNGVIELEPGASLVIAGWDGQTSFSLEGLLGVDVANLAIAGAYGYKVTGSGNAMTVSPAYYSELPGMKASAVVHEVEVMDRESVLRQGRPGFRYISDALKLNGRESFASNMDTVLTLPVSSGVLTAAESGIRSLFDAMSSRPIKASEAQAHWFAYGNHSKGKRGRHLLTVNGYAPLKTEADTVLLGADKTFANQWQATAYVAGISTDNKSATGTYVQSTSESTTAVIGAHLDKDTGFGHLRLEANYARTEAEAKMLNTGHILKSEPVMEMTSVGLRYKPHFDYGRYWLEPSVAGRGFYAKVKEGEITDNCSRYGIYGVGFETEMDKRLWGGSGAWIKYRISLYVERLSFRA